MTASLGDPSKTIPAQDSAPAEKSKCMVGSFFAWLEEEVVGAALLPTNAFTRADHYALQRKRDVEVLLADPDVPIDTNHPKRTLRMIPMGRSDSIRTQAAGLMR